MRWWRLGWWPYLPFMSDPIYQDEAGVWTHVYKRFWWLKRPAPLSPRPKG